MVTHGLNRHFLGISCALALVLAAGCGKDAPHTNPLDPLSGAPEVGSVAGAVVRLAAPQTPVAGAEVTLAARDAVGGMRPRFVGNADNQGRFHFQGVPAGAYALRVQAPGFAEAADSVEVRLGRTAETVLALSGLPAAELTDLRTYHARHSWTETDTYMLHGTAEVTDGDGLGDVALVWLEVPEIGLLDTLAAVPGAPGRYTIALSNADMPAGSSISDLVGRRLVVKARDRSGQIGATPPAMVRRIIYEAPRLLNPIGFSETTNNYPLMRWERITPPFASTLTLRLVYEPDLNTQIVKLVKENIPAGTTTFAVTQSLEPGTYVWTVTVVDEFGNESRSTEARFRVL